MSHRQSYPALQHHCYLNYGGQGPIAQPTLGAIAQAYATLQEIGPFSGAAQTWQHQITAETRSTLATALGVSPQTLTLTENVSQGCNIALWGMDWRSGDHLLISDCEHPGIVAAVRELQRRFGLEVSCCSLLATYNDSDAITQIAEKLQPKTRLVVLSHVLWNTGQVLPLAEILEVCHKYPSDRPIRVLIDAAQSVGVLPLNLETLPVDFYAFTGHKWWCGPAGVGGLYVRPAVLAELHPTFIGWRGIETDSQGNPTSWKPDGQRFEVATSAYPLYAGLTAALQHHQAWGSDHARYDRIRTLSALLWQRLSELPGVHCLRTAPPEAGLVSFQLENHNPAPVVALLERQGILVRTIVNPPCIRACTHYLTLETEIDRLVEAIAHQIKS
jgi:L-cysteine/cystine lyase